MVPHVKTDLVSLRRLLSRIEVGDIRIPIFQRKFVWRKVEVRELFESIFRGVPIGSILLLQSSDRSLKANLESATFPQTPVVYPTAFLLDGMQRLSTLRGVLEHPLGKKPGSLFALEFDLKNQRFKHFNTEASKPWLVRMSGILEYETYEKAQIEVNKLGDADLTRGLLRLNRALQEYQLIVVTLDDNQHTREEIADVFRRINEYGVRLSPQDKERVQKWIMGS